MSLPSMVMVPVSGISRPAISRRSVVFPLPEGPRSTTFAWSGMVSETLVYCPVGIKGLADIVEFDHGITVISSSIPVLEPRLIHQRVRMVPVLITSVSTVTIRHKPATSDDDP